MATNDIFKRVYYNDGEGLTYPDSNDEQDFMSARLQDQILEKLVPGLSEGGSGVFKGDFELSAENGTDSPSTYCYALAGGQAYLAPGSANNAVKVTPGTLFQKVGVSDGNAASFLAYTFTGAEQVTIANGDPTNPRVDLIEMQLSYVTDDPQLRDFQDATSGLITTSSVDKKRQVQCVLQVKQGTPASTPTYPVADAGFVIIGAVRVGPNEVFTDPIDNTSQDQTQIQDHRFPLNVKAYVCWPSQQTALAGFALDTSTGLMTASSGTNNLLIPCPAAGQGGRLLGVQIPSTHITTGSVSVGQAGLTSVSSVSSALISFFPGDTSNTKGRLCRYRDVQANCSFGDPGKANASADGFGPPLWASGLRSIGELNKTQSTAWAFGSGLAVQFSNVDNATKVGAVTFYIAE